MAPNESKLAQAVFIHEQQLIAILPLRGGGGGERTEKIQQKTTLLGAHYHETKV